MSFQNYSKTIPLSYTRALYGTRTHLSDLPNLYINPTMLTRHISNNFYFLGERWVLTPRPPDSQSGALRLSSPAELQSPY